jgi:hypothetical protein
MIHFTSVQWEEHSYKPSGNTKKRKTAWASVTIQPANVAKRTWDREAEAGSRISLPLVWAPTMRLQATMVSRVTLGRSFLLQFWRVTWRYTTYRTQQGLLKDFFPTCLHSVLSWQWLSRCVLSAHSVLMPRRRKEQSGWNPCPVHSRLANIALPINELWLQGCSMHGGSLKCRVQGEGDRRGQRRIPEDWPSLWEVRIRKNYA